MRRKLSLKLYYFVDCDNALVETVRADICLCALLRFSVIYFS